MMMKNLMFSFSILLLISSIQLYSQETIFRVVTREKGVFYCTQWKEVGDRLNFQKINGTLGTIKSNYPIRIEAIHTKPGWRYINWIDSKFYNHISVPDDSLSKQELFNHAHDWIKKSYVITNNSNLGIPIKEFPKKITHHIPKFNYRTIMQKTVSNLNDYKFSIDTVNYIIRIVASKDKVLRKKPEQLFYAIDLVFENGQYKFVPLDLWYYKKYQKYQGYDNDDDDDDDSSILENLVTHALSDIISGSTVTKFQKVRIPVRRNDFVNDKERLADLKVYNRKIGISDLLSDLKTSLYNHINKSSKTSH